MNNTKYIQDTYHIKTFGCQMNEHDSETMAGMLDQLGYQEVEAPEQAQVLIINTCSVRDNADKSFFGALGQWKKLKTQEGGRVVCVGGCMMQQEHIVKEIQSKYPWVDVVFGTHNLHQLPELIGEVQREHKRKICVWDQAEEMVEGLPAKRLHSHKALVDIMYGCNNFCTYCIVPHTRGRERSRKAEDILQEVRELVRDGVREIMLLGQNVNSYQPSFPDLIHKLAEVKGLDRIRFMTSHPKDISPELIQAYGQFPPLSKYIHLPVQAGSNEVLKRMNRGYTREHYLSLIHRFREVVPEIAISTDIIVGFPGETEKDFEDTLDLVRQVAFDSAFTFLYSIRKGTPAEHYPEQIPEDIKHERFNRLVEEINGIALQKNSAYVGKIEPVLVEGFSKRTQKTYQGRTDTFKLVNFPAEPEDVGKILPVEITEANTFSLKGRIQR
jgi:tRNA-2-methylthio-N6-dimethylallyladenosine synthase